MNNSPYGAGYYNPYAQPFGGYQAPTWGGYQPQKAPQIENLLTPEEMKELKDKSGLSLQVTREEILCARCTHKENGMIASPDPDTGIVTCPICNEQFKFVELNKEEVERKTRDLLDVIDTIKLSYIDIPVEYGNYYYKIIPLLKKLPTLYNLAINNFTKYRTGMNPQYGAGAMNDPYGVYNTVVSGYGPYAPQYQGYGAPQYQYPPQYGAVPQYPPQYGQPQYGQPQPGGVTYDQYGNPVQTPQYAQAPQYDPFGNPPQQSYAPGGNPFAAQAPQPQAPPQPAVTQQNIGASVAPQPLTQTVPVETSTITKA